MTDAFTTASAIYIAARRTAQRDRRTPVATPATIVGELGDPRAVPFDARVRPFSLLRHLPALFCLAIVIGCVWAAGLAVSG